MTEANEFWKIYKLDVIAIHTNRDLHRIESPDVIYRTEREKYIAVAQDIERHHKWDVLVFSADEEWYGTILKETDDEVVLELAEGKKKETVPKSKIRRIERKGRPVLIGTTSIEKSERLSALLDKRGVKHQVLNAKFHEREAEIVAQAGRLSAVTAMRRPFSEAGDRTAESWAVSVAAGSARGREDTSASISSWRGKVASGAKRSIMTTTRLESAGA
jgi:preprotein translocase subunit SecA